MACKVQILVAIEGARDRPEALRFLESRLREAIERAVRQQPDLFGRSDSLEIRWTTQEGDDDV